MRRWCHIALFTVVPLGSRSERNTISLPDLRWVIGKVLIACFQKVLVFVDCFGEIISEFIWHIGPSEDRVADVPHCGNWLPDSFEETRRHRQGDHVKVTRQFSQKS